MRILFIGSVHFSKKALLSLFDLGAEVVGVVTKKESSFNADFCDLAPFAKERGVPCLYTDNVNDAESEAWIRSCSPDVIFCFGWSSLIKSNILNLAPLGVLGFHPSLLPHNRGRHPLIWALVLGLEETGSTFFFMDEGADSGDILSQERVLIELEDDAKSLYAKIENKAVDQIREFYPKLLNRSYSRMPQDLSLGNVWRKRGRADGRIDFRMSSTAIYNLVRALTRPYVGAHIEFQGTEVKVWRVAISNFKAKENLEPGLVLNVSSSGVITVKTQDGAIDLLEHEFKAPVLNGKYF